MQAQVLAHRRTADLGAAQQRGRLERAAGDHALRLDLPGNVEGSTGLGRVHIAALDVEHRKGPFGEAIPQQILDAGDALDLARV